MSRSESAEIAAALWKLKALAIAEQEKLEAAFMSKTTGEREQQIIRASVNSLYSAINALEQAAKYLNDPCG